MGNITAMIDLSEAEIARRLAQALRKNPDLDQPELPALQGVLNGPPRPAAVLIPFLRQDGKWRLLFTRRNARLPEHSGQVAFPGGRSDPQDQSIEQTALRETFEEIGVQPQDVRVLGRLGNYITITNYRVTPVVGVIPWPYRLHLAPEEVSRVFTIPLDWLANPANYEERHRMLPEPFGRVQVIFYKPYDGETLWGASARFTLALLASLALLGL
jgi:8-oxo-dGTP pyrophosphatase MutT (NUDIX family)